MMRAKMQVNNVVKYGDPVNQIKVTMNAVCAPQYPADGSDEDNTYSRYTPTAIAELVIQNPALLDKFEVGQRYYVDFTAAP